MTSPVTIESNAFLIAFEHLDADAPIHSLRREALDQFANLGFPTLKDEEWRYTNMKPITQGEFDLARGDAAHLSKRDIAEYTFTQTPCHQIVFVNGRYAPHLSEIGEPSGGARVESLAAVIEGDFSALRSHLARYTEPNREVFTALNTAFIEDGVFVHLPREVRLDKPVHMIFLTTPEDVPVMTHPRILIVAEANSRATIIETCAAIGGDSGGADGAYFTNTVTEMVVGENAHIDHYRLGLESEQALHVSSLNVRQAASSNVTCHNFTFGGRLVRNNINAALEGEGIHTTFNGLNIGRDRQHVDNYLRIDHLKPNCNSWEYYKTILDDRARGVFMGRIYVAPDAQKTDAKQTSANMLLSDDANVTTMPQLEIFADDVKCTHGATTGQLEESQLFYLQARGIDKVAARSLLIYAFANEMIEEVKIEELRRILENLLLDRLPQGHLLRGGL